MLRMLEDITSGIKSLKVRFSNIDDRTGMRQRNTMKSEFNYSTLWIYGNPHHKMFLLQNSQC